MSNLSYIYFIRPIGQPGPVKIGCSRAPRRRLEEIARWSPIDLEIVATIPGGHKLEHNLHDCFANDYLRFEWFAASDKLTNLIEDLRAGVPVSRAIDLNDRQGRVLRKGNIASPDALLRASYRRRIHAAEERLRERGEDTNWRVPDDVGLIMDAWEDRLHRVIPTATQLGRIEAYLADPASHSIEAPMHLRKRAAA